MKISKIVTLMIVGFFLTIPGFAATTGSLVLTGIVSDNMEIIVTPEAIASNLDLLTTTTDLKVATVTEKSNTGYTVTLTTTNSSALVGQNATPDSLSYSLKYGGTAVSFTAGSAVITDSTSQTGVSGIDKDLTISYTGNTGLQADTYEDTLTFTIAVK